MFKQLNTIEKLLLKINDGEAYKDYKFLSKWHQLKQPSLIVTNDEDIHFKHSGNAGDIIYSLPTIFKLGLGKSIHLHLNINKKAQYGKKKHPLGNVMLNKNIASLLSPLLMSQQGFKVCDIYNSQIIDFDLDLIREFPINLKYGNIARWYFLVFGINADLGKPWLQISPDTSFNNAIVIARSQRYHSPGINYNFLQEYFRTVFIGLPEEYADMKRMIPKIEYKPVEDFLELASIIAGAALFIGNQSFPFSLAEALKVKRLLEVYHLSPNVNIEGPLGYDFCWQPQFEKLVAELYTP